MERIRLNQPKAWRKLGEYEALAGCGKGVWDVDFALGAVSQLFRRCSSFFSREAAFFEDSY